MYCEYEKVIDKLVEGNLSEVEERKLIEHAKVCSNCHQKLDLLKLKDTIVESHLDNFSFNSNKVHIIENIKRNKNKVSLKFTLHRHKSYAFVLGCLILFIISFSIVKPFLLNPERYVSGNAEVKSSNYKYFEIPNKIIINDHGNVKEIDISNELFIKILDATNNRFIKKPKHFALAISTAGLDKMGTKEVLVEFVYSKERKTDGRKYKRLFFPMSGEYNRCMFYDEGDVSSGGPVGNLTPPDELLELIKTIYEK